MAKYISPWQSGASPWVNGRNIINALYGQHNVFLYEGSVASVFYVALSGRMIGVLSVYPWRHAVSHGQDYVTPSGCCAMYNECMRFATTWQNILAHGATLFAMGKW